MVSKQRELNEPLLIFCMVRKSGQVWDFSILLSLQTLRASKIQTFLDDRGRRKQNLTSLFVNDKLSLFSHFVASPVKLFYILNISLIKFPIHVMLEIKSSYNLVRLSLFKVFLDNSVWWRNLHCHNHPSSTNFSPLFATVPKHGGTTPWPRSTDFLSVCESRRQVWAPEFCHVWACWCTRQLPHSRSMPWVWVGLTRQPGSEPCSGLKPEGIEIFSSPCLHSLNETFWTSWDWSRQYCVKTFVEWGSGTKSSAGGNPPK